MDLGYRNYKLITFLEQKPSRACIAMRTKEISNDRPKNMKTANAVLSTPNCEEKEGLEALTTAVNILFPHQAILSNKQ